ncbi:MAG: hypothetical protein ACRD0Z_01960 [Acidimicrobiales bacterium]
MRPPIDVSAIELLLDEVPEFGDGVDDLVHLYDDNLCAEVVLMEFADFVDALPGGQDEYVLGSCFAAVERIAQELDEGRYLVAYSFLACLAHPEMHTAYFGPVTVELMHHLDAGVGLDADGWPVAPDGLE